MVGGHLPKKLYVFLIMMKYDDLYFASRYNFFTDCVEWYFLPKTEIKVFLKTMDIRGFGWRPSICIPLCVNLKVLESNSVFIFNGKIYSLCQNNSISKQFFFKIQF